MTLLYNFSAPILKIRDVKKIIGLLVLVCLLTGCYRQDGVDDSSNPVVVGPAVRGSNMALGNPSGATSDIVNADNYLMNKVQYSLSYNNGKHTANWVSWHLSTAWLGSVDRQDNFRADITLPSSWIAIDTYGFSGSGFDRGHICPSADRTLSVEDNSATFLMTNMMPQAPNNNQIPWANFESYCRTLVKSGYELYIVAGPAGVGGTGSRGYYEKWGDYGIVVPKYTWKVVLAIFNGENDLVRIDTKVRTIAIWMPNDQAASKKSWYDYRVSIDEVEANTGFDFFSSIPDDVEKVIEARTDNAAI